MSSQILYRVLLCNGTGTHYLRTAGPDGAIQVVNTAGLGAEPMPPPLPIGEAEVLRRDATRWWGPYRFELEWAGEAPLIEDELVPSFEPEMLA